MPASTGGSPSIVRRAAVSSVVLLTLLSIAGGVMFRVEKDTTDQGGKPRTGSGMVAFTSSGSAPADTRGWTLDTGANVVQSGSLTIEHLTSATALGTSSTGMLIDNSASVATFSYADVVSWFVDDVGDTMTGALNVVVTGGTSSTIGFESPNTVSGAVVQAGAVSVSGGTLTVEGSETNDAVLVLDADDGDDAADTWTFESEAADNDLSVINGTTERVRITAAGVLHSASHSGQTVVASGGNVDVQAAPFFAEMVASGTTLGTGALTNHLIMPFDGEFLWVHCGVYTANSAEGLTEIQVRHGGEQGTSIFSTTCTVDATETGSYITAATAPVINHAANDFNLGDKLTVTVVQAKGATRAKGLFLWGVTRKLRVQLTQP